MKSRPGDATILAALGGAYLNENQYALAVENYQKAVALQPDMTMGFYNLGIAQERKGDWGGAIGSLEKYQKLAPKDPRGPFELGNSFFNSRQYALAAESYRAAVALDPNFAPSHYNLAQALVHTGDSTEAEIELETARKLDPKLDINSVIPKTKN